MDTCTGCAKTIEGWHTIVRAQYGPDPGDYHKGCFDEMVRRHPRGQWLITVDQSGPLCQHPRAEVVKGPGSTGQVGYDAGLYCPDCRRSYP